MQYLKTAKETFKELKGNLVLLLPTIAIFFMGLFFTIAFLYINGLLPSVLEDISILFSSDIGTGAGEIINRFLGDTLVLKTIASFILFFSTNFLVGSSLLSVKFSMMKDIVEGRKTNLKKGFVGATKNYFRVIGMRILVYLIYAVLAIIFSSYLLFVKGINESNLPLIIFLIGFSIFVVKIILLFRYPIMFIDNLKPIKAVRKTFSYFLERKRRVLIVWFIIFIIASIASLTAFILGRITSIFGGLLFSSFIVLLISSFFKIIIDLVIDVWGDLYIFTVYKKTKEK